MTYKLCKKNEDGILIEKEVSEDVYRLYLNAGWEEVKPQEELKEIVKKDKKSKRLFVAEEEE